MIGDPSITKPPINNQINIDQDKAIQENIIKQLVKKVANKIELKNSANLPINRDR